MALLKLGTLASMIRGSIGGTTYANNRAGAYARNRTKPINPMTAKQTASRARFGNQSNGWSGLDAGLKGLWQDQALTVTLLNRVGDSYTPTGRQLFLQLNNNLAHSGFSTITSPPGDTTPPDIDPAAGITLQVDAGALSNATFNMDASGPGISLIVESVPLSSGNRVNNSNLYRYVGTFPADDPVDVTTAFTALFGAAAVEGQIGYFRIRTLNETTGYTSAPLIVSGVVVAA